ncbi:13694_t:CDS:10 [Funneliformis geosporum]|uniref:13694_t:CDS:1 n=1 Tax=Funneliformis geosporum TaxID=1117311 RepID=A0A9W4WKT2_9GLOM|nr:13694_t:CDS:10 [Funneliformis geosporum]
MASEETPLVPIRIEPNDPSDLQNRNEPQLVNDNATNQQLPIDTFQRELIDKNLFNTIQRSEEKETIEISDQTQTSDSFPFHNLSEIMNTKPSNANNTQSTKSQNKQPSDNLLHHNLSEIMDTKSPDANDKQRSESDKAQNKEPTDNLIFRNLPSSGDNDQQMSDSFRPSDQNIELQFKNMNFFSGQHDQKINENAKEPQNEQNQLENAITTDFDQIINSSIFAKIQKGKSSQSQSDESFGLTSDQEAIRKKPMNEVPRMGTSFGNEIKRIDPKENIRKVLKNHKHHSFDYKYGKDLDEYIPGLYRLLDLCKDDGSNGLVDKIIISKDSLKKLCNDMVPSSFKSISEINYTKLNSISFRLIGCYGNHTLIAKLLLDQGIINQQMHDCLTDSQSSVNKPSLRPGIYLIVVNADLGLVIHWPEVECYEENGSSQRKKNMTNLHRYLTKLTDHQLCLMSDKDLQSFDWKLDKSDDDSDDDEASYEYEVKKSQEEQENFKIYPGFKVNLSNNTKTEINYTTQDEISLYPIVVESATNQSFVTRELMQTAKTLNKSSINLSYYTCSNELRNKLKGHSLFICRESMNFKQLELLVKNETISRMMWKKLKDSYSSFEGLINSDTASHENNTIGDEDIKRIKVKYPDIEDKINEKIQINSNEWRKLKKRFVLACFITQQVLNISDLNSEQKQEMTKSGIRAFYELFIDRENDTYKLVKNFERKSRGYLYSIFSTISSSLTSHSYISELDQCCKDYVHQKSDSDLVKELIVSSFFGEFTDIKRDVVTAFLNEYQKWRKDTFPNNIKEILPKFDFKQSNDKLNQELCQAKNDIEVREFERICSELEEKFHQSDTLQIQNDELHIPTLHSSYQYGKNFFQIDPAVYDFKKISQFDNRKFLLVLHNKKSQKIEIFFGASQHIIQTVKTNKPFKSLNIDENFLIAINEPKELIAIYRYTDNDVMLNVYALYDGQTHFYPRHSNIQLLQWYNNTVPNLQYFFFIKNTEELCFVEKSGRARIFNLVTQQFRPAICKLPSNTSNVLSSPDGSCIVAFVKENLKSNTINIDSVESRCTTDGESDGDSVVTNHEQQQDDSVKVGNIKETCRAYVYFCANFGDSVSKVVDLPTALQSLEFLQFTCINKIQTHLMSFDLQSGCFNSSIVKITLEKTQYRFQERMQKKSLGLAKLIYSPRKNVGYSIIEGRNTHFEKIVRNNEFIVLMGEKFNVIEVLSNTKLKVSGNFKKGFDDWMEFRIEPKTKLNGLIDAYKMMFEKYPVESCVDSEQNRPLSLKIVLNDELGDEKIEEYGEKFEEYISEIFENLKRSTKKPATILKKFSTSITTYQKLDINNVKFQKKFSSIYEIGEWIIQLCCLIPIQIAVARNNLFQPLKDGLSSNDIELDDGYGGHVEGIAKNISFGWYEGIFRHFGDKKVKVVSSMGEQSCGKSFMLNHLVGTTFDGSAMRCTEGVWMSLVNTKQYIYVALDFEGLKSLERTPQEDLFLTLFNTVVSNLILFKNQFAVNRDMSSMFQRFQDGAMLFESDPKIFQAKLCVIIKDVPKADKEDIVKEFKSKFSQLVAEEGEDNFISRMYKGGLDIIPWPMFNDASWFKTLSKVNKNLNNQEPRYENARNFLRNTKVIMAKLKICDWGSLDENLIQIRVATLKRLLPTVISFGLEQKDSTTEQLMNRDTGEPIEDSAVNFSEILHDFEESDIILSDSDILLYDENVLFDRLSEDLRTYFEENIQSRKTSSDDLKWFTNFNGFFKYIIDRRISRVKNWYMQNTAKFPQDNSDIVNGKYAMEQEISKLILLWTFCGLTCHQCGLKCVKNRDHENDHDCLTDHKCHFGCHFVEAHNNKLIPVCSHKAGHEGKHACDKIDHLCGKPCNLIDKRNCQKVCSKEIGHEDEHLCQSTLHFCGKTCSLSTKTQKGDYSCPNKCIRPYEEQHDLHRCENPTCPIQCPIPRCQRKCQINDHFHSFSNLPVNHFCGDEHQCRELCEDDGRSLQRTSYQYYIYEACIKKIPPNEFKHTGKHTHEEGGFHYCDAKCQFCEYFCTLSYGHAQILHNTTHGNMTQTEFTGEDNEFEYAGHRLKVGDQGTFVLCNVYCKDLGRHRHIDYCHNEEIHPNPDKPKDFISHKLFWERTGFRDPYSAQDQQEFAKCDHECPDEKHHKSQGSTSAPPTKSFCELSLFHAPLIQGSNPPNDYGYISLDGHHFSCENPSTREAAFHIIFVMDRSGSMSEKDKKPLRYHPGYNELIIDHNNRTGAVYQAVYQFMETRFASAQTNQNQVSSALRDSVTLILFDHKIVVPFENQNLTNMKELLNIMLQYKAGGGTNFDNAIQKAGYLITSYFDPTKANIIIFLSDGECGVPTNQLHNICKQNHSRGSPLYLYTVLFSSSLRSHSLEEMARIAQSYHPQNSSSSALRCQFTNAIDEVSLVNHFTGVAESLRKHKPALLKKKN